MGEKYYRPIVKEGDHLVRSSKNPDRVRGQSRDSDNKNPDIVEWEEVEIETASPSREELEYELQKRAFEVEQAEQDRALSTLDAINTGLDAINNLLTFLNENPEVVEAIVVGGKKAKNFISDKSKKIAEGVKGLFAGSKKTKAEAILEKKKIESRSGLVSANNEVKPKVNKKDSEFSNDKEDMSIEEARTLVIEILANYINMKKNLERLSKAKINETDFPQLDMNQVLAYMDTVVEKYPALMDDKTSTSILDLLNGNANNDENARILETLKIEL